MTAARAGFHPTRLRAVLVLAATLVAGQALARACSVEAVRCCAPEAGARQDVRTGLGYHIWPSNLSAEALRKLVALSPRHLRFSYGPNWRDFRVAPDADPAAVEAVIEEGMRRRGPALAREREVMRALRAATGAEHHLVVWEPPRIGDEAPASPDGKGRRLTAENVPAMARFLVAFVDRVRRDIPVDTVELSNEPDGTWNIEIAPAVYLELVRAIRAEARQRGVALPRILGPGTGMIATGLPYVAGQQLSGVLDGYSVHGWDGSGRDVVTALSRNAQAFRSLPLVVSEFGLSRTVAGATDPRLNAAVRSSDNVSWTPAYAAAVALRAMAASAAGAQALVYWEYQDQTWNRSSFGLLDETGREKPLYGAMQALSRVLTGLPAAVRADGKAGEANDNGRRVAVVVNAGPLPMEAILPGRPREPGADLGGCEAPDGQTGVVVPPQGVVTIDLAP